MVIFTSIVRYGCVATRDEYSFRQFQINLLEFETIKNLIFMNPKFVYKFSTLKEYPKLASEFVPGQGDYTVEQVNGMLRFRTRIKNKPNKLFDSLEDCANFCKMLYLDEGEYARLESLDYLVCQSGIPEFYYEKCYNLLDENIYVLFAMLNGKIPVYRLWRIEKNFRSLDNDAIIGDVSD